MNILEFISHPDLCGDAFEGDSWKTWRAILAATFALPFESEIQASIFNRIAGGRKPPTKRVRELWIVAGRRSAKSHMMAAMAVYTATVGASIAGIEKRLSAGERGVVAILAVDRDQAKILLSYVKGIIEDSPVLSGMVEKSDTDAIHLTNRCTISVQTNSFRAVRGRTLLACIFDEVAFWRNDRTATPDIETYRAAAPGLATLGGMLIGISSPYAKRGILYDRYRDHFGRDSDVLVIQGETTVFNPTLDPAVIADAYASDPESAAAEYGGLFRNDVDSFISRDAIDGLVRSSPLELPYDSAHRYCAFLDPAGGGADEFTLAIAHHEKSGVVVVDLVRGMKGTPAAIMAEYSMVLKTYHLRTAVSDRYAGSWPRDEALKHGITLKPSESPKSDLYHDVLPIINSGRVELPADTVTINQFTQLERRTSRAGRDSIDHCPGGHDDRANAVAGAVVNAALVPECIIFTGIRSCS